MAEIGIDGVMAAQPVFADRARLEPWLDRLDEAVRAEDRTRAEAVFEEAVPGFRRRMQTLAPAERARPVLQEQAAIRGP